ncbi:lactonase family protein [Pseudactinotalea sp.]|uniref:lactonase family protein n=1 Tax=Pseudactinotalea sp. TaxID=1926260 RepID=UPI003B3B6F21
MRLIVGAWNPGGAPGRLVEVDPGESRTRELASSSAVAIAEGRGGVIYTAGPEGVAAWSRDADGVHPLGERYSSQGTLACHVAVTADGAHAIAAHYDGGLVTVHPIAADGSLGPVSDVAQLQGAGPDRQRQEAAHPHMVWCGLDGEVLVTDLGADLVRRFRLEEGRLVAASQIRVPAGTGPRHLVVLDGLALVVGELADTLIAVDLGAEQVLHVEPCGADGLGGSSPSAITLSADRQRCHVLRRGPDTIATFSLGPRPRLLGQSPCGGQWPWDLAVAGGLLYVANQRSGTVAVLRTDPVSGLPVPAGEGLSVPDATSLLVV